MGWLNINIAVALDAILAGSMWISYRFSVIWYSFIVLALVCENDDDSHAENKTLFQEREKNLFLSNWMALWFDFTRFHRVFMLNLAAKSIRMKSKAK